jgi:hypothetical protein
MCLAFLLDAYPFQRSGTTTFPVLAGVKAEQLSLGLARYKVFKIRVSWWSDVGIPPDYLCLFASVRGHFSRPLMWLW